MKKLAVKYLLEFIVIVIGISLSFYVEEIDKQKDKEEFKNQSLNRILQNLESDIRDNKWNLKAVSKSIESGEWIYKNRKKLKKYSRDSIGFHLARANGFITIFVDNQEEYSTLKSSGYLELIENESIVKSLQNKYSNHAWMKEVERFIIKKSDILIDFEFKNSELNSESLNDLGFLVDKKYIGDLNIPKEIIGRIIDKKFWQKNHLNSIKNRLRKDSILIEEITKEINKK
tara:strand:+ start:151 stop:840 length:690 start_codon:yes stop_codon:yes gene_type:complete